MIKGVDVHEGKIGIIADVIQNALDIPCAALSGANIANEVARDKFSETTVGYRPGGRQAAEIWYKLFNTSNFRVGLIEDVAGVSLCGALKNIVAIGAGFCDGLGWGDNAKAAIMRIGILEMKNFAQEFFVDVKPETFTETSAGIADLITTCTYLRIFSDRRLWWPQPQVCRGVRADRQALPRAGGRTAQRPEAAGHRDGARGVPIPQGPQASGWLPAVPHHLPYCLRGDGTQPAHGRLVTLSLRDAWHRGAVLASM